MNSKKLKAIEAVTALPSKLSKLTAFQNDKDVVLAAVKKDGSTLKFASEILRGDEDVVMEALNRSGTCLEYATENLRGDKNIVLGAVTKNGYALEFATHELQDDEPVVMAATSSTANALQYANSRFWDRHDLVLAYVQFHLAEYYEIEDFSELSKEQLEDEDGPFRFLDLDLVRDAWANRPGLKCPNCGGRHI